MNPTGYSSPGGTQACTAPTRRLDCKEICRVSSLILHQTTEAVIYVSDLSKYCLMQGGG